MFSISILGILGLAAIALLVLLPLTAPVRPRYKAIWTAALIAVVGYGFITAGWRADDQCSVTLSGDATHTIVAAGGEQFRLENVPWKHPTIEFQTQIGGWTGSSGSPLAGQFDGGHDYVQTNYDGKGVNELTIGESTVWLVKDGDTVRIAAKDPMAQ